MKILKKLTLLLFFLSFSTVKAQKFTISGYISDEKNGEKLIGANIYEPKLKTGTSTNLYGFFSLTLPASDSVYLVMKYIGYQPKVFNLKLDKDIKLNVNLSPSIDLKTVEIVEERLERIEEQSQMSVIEIPISQIKSIPALLGEVDVLKGLQLLPGVQSGNEGSSGLYVRGGGPDQNLILLDGAPVYNVSHLFGFFSVFNADAIRNVQLTKGGFPARYGGRLSSVIEINMKEGNANKISGEGSLGLIASKLTLEGPLIKNKASFIVSARRTYIDYLLKPITKKMYGGPTGYYFYDLNAKLNYKVSEKDHIFLSSYGGDDRFYSRTKETYNINGTTYEDDSNFSLGWGNITSTLRWNRIITPKLFCNTSLIYSKYNFDFRSKMSNKVTAPIDSTIFEFNGHYLSGIQEWSGKIDFDFHPSPDHSIKFGAGNIYHQFNTGATQITGLNIGNTEEIPKPIYAHEQSAYFEDDWKISSRLKANTGIHYAGFLVNNKYYKSLQPRISSRYMLNQNWALKGSYASMMQFLHLLTNTGVGLPTDLWVPATELTKPQEAWQTAVGAAKTLKFREQNYEFSLEGYYKHMKNMIEYKEGANFLDQSKDWQQKVEVGDGLAYGTELFLQKKTGKTTGWIGYTLSWSERQFKNLNLGKKFPYKYDRRHDFSFVVTHQLKENIDIAATWVYGTGNAITLPITTYQGFSNTNGYREEIYYYGERNSFRMRSYHRLDLGINFRKFTKWGERTINVSLYNAYSRRNPFYYELTTNLRTGNRQLVQHSLFPIIPSISYNFKF